MDDERPEPEPKWFLAWAMGLESWASGRFGAASRFFPIAAVMAAWGYLNGFMNASVHGAWSLWPSFEPTLLLAVVCGLAWFGIRVRSLPAVLATLFLVALKLFGLADEVIRNVVDRPLHLGLDSGLLWESFIVMDDSYSREAVLAYAVGGALVVGLLAFLVEQALIVSSHYFGEKIHRVLFSSAFGLVLLLALAFSEQPSLVGRLFEEIGSLGSAGDRRAEMDRVLGEASSRVENAGRLEALNNRDVYLIHIPSYGNALLADPSFAGRMEPAIRVMGERLADAGYEIGSSLLAAPALGGLSWLSQATLASGATIEHELDFELLLASETKLFVDCFSQSGYRTIQVLSGAARERPERELGNFSKRYHAWELGYEGAAFGRVPMPDQFVLDRILRQEIHTSTDPLFIEYQLSSTRAPFDVQPGYVEDWTSIDAGAAFVAHDAKRFDLGWFSLERGQEAWLHAMTYELEVLEHYLLEVVDSPAPTPTGRRGRRRRAAREGDPLYILVGDHQPPSPILGSDPSRLVPIHVLSKDAALVEPFRERGYGTGMIPAADARPMAAFLPLFIEIFDEVAGVRDGP